MDTSLAWFLAGVLLLGIELFSFTFVTVFFGIGAILVSLLTYLGVVDDLTSQVFLFSAASVVTMLLLRNRFCKWMKGHSSNPAGSDESESVITGSFAVAETDFENGIGKVRLRGAQWSAKSPYNEQIRKGDHVHISGQEGITLIVTKQL